MSKIAGSEATIELMVNCKTYPAVSEKYVETVCTGGVQRNGEFVRLYPVPFRFLNSEEQYERWDIIQVRAYRTTRDKRPESWHFIPGTPIKKIGSTKENESERWQWMSKAVFASTEEMESRGLTNGCVEIEPLELYWKPDLKEWSASQLRVIHQGDLFAKGGQMKGLSDVIPWQYRLKYREKSTGREFDGKVLAWSYYAGYRSRIRDGKTELEALESVANTVRKSIFNDSRSVFAILGTHSRFGHWMISALYHLPTSIRRERRLFW
ncbi:hypothetical protein [Planctomicrobium sp. SH527]|uniref:hypothetical protein n=1 Tax=Planctomicrobium sp. SH527 TaxID=3448123 RepID=UPI003F5AFD47